MTKPTLAVALIVKNESKHLRACLETVQGWVDEIVILDSGSSDDTKAIAEEMGAKFYTNSDWPGFGLQRQIAQSHVQSDSYFGLMPMSASHPSSKPVSWKRSVKTLQPLFISLPD
ncbi:lipopolysaccharide biosynthesis glycosyltransferase [Vibrio maritimus]|uniref:Lipopolysaccharide biosynthesis glycosyltransferase n=1 Tax=Vibrio maritimus TaxID=990268 RepID=A0A090U3U3_9VIBR|nr:lipopolysaccharide biosynthesis glycosyltransferase [Vibrio maritimus]